MGELEATDIVQQKLLSEIEELVKVKDASNNAAKTQDLELESVFGTMDMKEASKGQTASFLLKPFSS